LTVCGASWTAMARVFLAVFNADQMFAQFSQTIKSPAPGNHAVKYSAQQYIDVI
jgi:hypothetical protein